jgi:hypothetical protein
LTVRVEGTAAAPTTVVEGALHVGAAVLLATMQEN